MPAEAPVAPTPVAAPAAPAQSGSAFPSSSGEINASTMTRTATPSTTPVARSAQSVRPPAMGQPPAPVHDDGKKPSEKLFENLRGLANKKDPNAPPEARATPPEDPNAEPQPGEDDELIATAPTDPKTATGTTTPEKKGKVNPWKVIEEHKAARLKAEAEIAELRKAGTDVASLQKERERIAAVEKRNQELEEKIKFVDFKESPEFQEKYQKPYKAAWDLAMSELSELTVLDAHTGQERPMAPNDLLDLVQMPLREAIDSAKEIYGSAADTVMGYRAKIKALYQQQADAIATAKKNGVESAAKQTAAQQEKMQQINSTVGKHWEEVNKHILANETTGQYFKPVEGNEEINSRLEKGYKFVDETMAVNPMNPNLTEEQRVDAVKRHASLRHRAAAFGRMRMELEQSRKSETALKARLAQFEQSTPNFGGDAAPNTVTTTNGGRMDALRQRLAARAK
jgi:hypothetical protein